MFAALVGEFLGLYVGLKDLAGVFSGWITAVIRFYFLQQNTERAQRQTGDVISRLVSVSLTNITELKGHMDKQQEFINELISKLEEMSETGNQQMG